MGRGIQRERSDPSIENIAIFTIHFFLYQISPCLLQPQRPCHSSRETSPLRPSFSSLPQITTDGQLKVRGNEWSECY